MKAREPPRQHVIRFFANEVFTVDDGPPREIRDPANQAFIACIMKGECPPELNATADTDVQLVNVPEDYVAPARTRCERAGCHCEALHRG